MEKILKKAFKEASKLDKEEQKSFDAFIFEELKKEKEWQSSLENSEKKLRTLAEEALSEYKAGNAESLDSDKL